MATSNSATLKLEYEDGSTRNLTFDEVPSSALQNMKSNILSLNGTIADSVTGAAYRDTFISDEGSPIKKISGAKYTITESTVIYDGN